ncbi:hypothetical protein IJD44_04600, partial [bacterium]|nr:hypothetical protein [bacterium]
DEGGTTTPDEGGTTTPDEGGTTTPDEGGTTTPDEGGTTTPDEGGTTTPDEGGTTTPDEGGTDTDCDAPVDSDEVEQEERPSFNSAPVVNQNTATIDKTVVDNNETLDVAENNEESVQQSGTSTPVVSEPETTIENDDTSVVEIPTENDNKSSQVSDVPATEAESPSVDVEDEGCGETGEFDVVENESRDSFLSSLTSSVLGHTDEDIQFFD